MLHSIKAGRYQATFSRSACAWLMVDGIGVEQWVAQHLDYEQAATLGLSLIWLLDEDEEKLAKRRFIPGEDGTSTLVSLLVCSDDMDFDCTVLMVEQVVADGVVTWARFGMSVSGGLEVGAQTRWMTGFQPVSFAVSDFQQALQDFETILVTPTT
ncbi:hypothetical protein EGJ22_06405 [Pseudomonas sp. p99-361]|uniref:Uncharacterized protein n=2 Tax=Pseudomonas TaxID=286 RepID=A0A7W2LL62_9PSED|nr:MULTISPECIES: hypothetical protein [Pseudomonas]OAK53313.1 hypothetical protein A3K88_07530 [Pseudomonas putida]PPB16772.1 hypothetical protein HV87_19785 [Pseudomonas aeruginosa]AYN16814.1 hypothetical protein CHR29_17350 [Pseudomonas monteilii]AYN99567.1 hypothetical protein D8767_11535 [Pseudomonas sp. LTGT-11-2Z]MBA6142895.1 hypothetical protein [Pseudomonas juntendi]